MSPCDFGRGGFTLLELLVAMAIFAIVGTLAMGGLNAVLRQREVAARQLERLHQVQRAVRIISNDFAQLNPRYVRDLLGGEPANQPPLESNCEFSALVCLSRGGWRNPFWSRPRGLLQRVQYRFEDSKLVRVYWPVMDYILISEPRQETLLDDLNAVEFAYLDPDTGKQWLTQWPQPKRAAATGPFPAGIRVTLRLKDWGEIRNVVEVAR